MSRSLWMGDLENYMDETFVNQAFQHISQPVSVKVIRRKDNGLPAGYCFLEFATEAEAERVLKLVNGTNIPHTTPNVQGVPVVDSTSSYYFYKLLLGEPKDQPVDTKRFRLNRSQAGKMWDIGPSYSIFVGDLDPSVTDDKLEDFFLKRYRSVKGAKIMYEEGGVSRGYGFVRFSDENEQKRALNEMQGARGLGGKAIRVSVATPKGKLSTTSATTDSTDAAVYTQWMQQYADQYQYYQQYYNNYYSYPYSYYSQNQQTPTALAYQQQQQQFTQAPAEQYSSAEQYQASRLQDKLEDPSPPIDIDGENETYFAEHSSLIDHVLGNHWQPLDSLTSRLPELTI